MEKEALINIILHDLDEMQTLVSTFKGKPAINSAFIQLAHKKLNNIGDELLLLESLADEVQPTSNVTESTLTSPQVQSTPTEDASEIAESSNRFATGEATIDSTVEPIEPEVKKEPQVEVVESNVVETPVVETKEEVIPTQEIVPEPIPAAPVQEPTPTVKPSFIGESIKTESQSVNDRIAPKKDANHIMQIGKPVDDVRKAIGINDRFYFQRELFGGNTEVFNNTLDQLNQMDSFESALQFIQSNYSWDEDNEAAQSFIKNIHRRYI